MKRIALLMAFSQGCWASQCISYANPEFSGILYSQTFALEDAESSETVLLLKLPKAVCVSGGDDEMEYQPDADGIQRIQLSLAEFSDDEKLRQQSMGKTLTCVGELTSAYNGHHHVEMVLGNATCR
ncbi:hypothetical protein JV210_08345 [Plesiomonas shigelloides]|uniref:hypothetical protein n=1 Tax=Plesiomonas shigelloides TaxID=703 RepID=UPI001C04AFDC|nr:hypothetical protein [Plesiomonas shigelloides]QWK93627.1 hypothetical protein JV210_08345 [Plesiomonas shigelloides]